MSNASGHSTENVMMSKEHASIPGTTISVYQAIYGRRMARKFKDEPVPQDALQRMLEAAVWAPNHRLTEPWRFFVLAKGSPMRGRMADLAYQFARQRNNDSAQAERSKQAVLDLPVLVYVFCVPGNNDEVTRENYGATCCAIQNMALAGLSEGLSVTWETGGPTRHPDFRGTLGAEPDWTMVGMLSIGVPAETLNSRRSRVGGFVRWFGPSQGA